MKRAYTKTLTLHRKGRIDTDKASSNQCKDLGWTKYAYEVALTCLASNTDANGWIIDNSVVHQTIVSCFNDAMDSCERMVERVADCILAKAIEHGVSVLEMTVMIKPRGVDEDSYAWFTIHLSDIEDRSHI